MSWFSMPFQKRFAYIKNKKAARIETCGAPPRISAEGKNIPRVSSPTSKALKVS